MIEYEAKVICDRCGRKISLVEANTFLVPNKETMKYYARSQGWSIGKRVLCDKCRKRGERND